MYYICFLFSELWNLCTANPFNLYCSLFVFSTFGLSIYSVTRGRPKDYEEAKRVLAFMYIGREEKYKRLVEKMDANVAKRQAKEERRNNPAQDEREGRR